MLSFDQALDRSEKIHHRRHLLLGKGFGLACRPDHFATAELVEEADLDSLSVPGRSLFSGEESANFEHLIRVLEEAAELAERYETSDSTLAPRLREDAVHLKKAYADALGKKHPQFMGKIADEEYDAARYFLCNFGHFFYLTHDLLLYWALRSEGSPPVHHDDGFRADRNSRASWVSWNDYNPHRQNVYYLHGGIHLHADGSRLKKLTFSRTGLGLVEQIQAQLDEGSFPLIVGGKTPEEKHAGIVRHAYLSKGLRSLASCEGSLFIHGHSLGEDDQHITRAIVEGKFLGLFVGLEGDLAGERNEEIRRLAEELMEARPRWRPMEAVEFYDAETAEVWGDADRPRYGAVTA